MQRNEIEQLHARSFLFATQREDLFLFEVLNPFQWPWFNTIAKLAEVFFNLALGSIAILYK